MANVFNQLIGACLGVWIIYKRYLRKDKLIIQRSLFSLQRTKQLFSLNTDIFIRTFFLVLTTSFFARQSAYLGVEIVAANMILMDLQLLTSFALDGFTISAETLIGRAIGKRDEMPSLFPVFSYFSPLYGMIFRTVVAREKQLKAGPRKKKLALIEKMNPYWDDLYEELL